MKLAGKDYSNGALTEAGLDVVKNIDNDYLVYCYEKVIKCKWSKEILRRLERGPCSFTVLKRVLKIPDKTLSDRLKKKG